MGQIEVNENGDDVNAQVPSFSAHLEDLIARIVSEDHARELAHACQLPADRTRLLLETYCNEARVGLALIAQSLRPGVRILEVGTGIGLLANVLALHGVDIVGIEPARAVSGSCRLWPRLSRAT